MAWSWNKKHLAAAIAGVVATIVFGLVACLPSDQETSNTQTQGGSNNKQVQGGGQAADTINNYASEFQKDAGGLSLEEASKEAEKFKTVSPPVGDVAPYLVVAPGNLYVRNSPGKEGKHAGAAWDKTLVYAGCSVTTDFDPVLDDNVKGVWIKIRWPNLSPGEDMRSSQPSDPLQGWVYSGRVVPAGHNGKIRSC